MKPFSLAVLLLLLGACAHDLALMKRDETLNAYRAAIRWGSFDAAAKFQSVLARRPAMPGDVHEVKVSGYEVIAHVTDQKRMTLTQTVELRYYRTTNLVEKTTIDEQSWHYDQDEEKWVLDSPLPRFP